MPHELSPWSAVSQQTRRWFAADVCTTITTDPRGMIWLGIGRVARRTTALLDSRTLQSTPETGHRAGWDRAKRRKGSKVHLAVDMLGQLLAIHVTPANQQDRAQDAQPAAAVQAETGQMVPLADVDPG